jgi:hypothetical protein
MLVVRRPRGRLCEVSQTRLRRAGRAEDLTMLTGPASHGAPLEIGILDIDGEDPVIIHAVALRSKFYRFLG